MVGSLVRRQLSDHHLFYDCQCIEQEFPVTHAHEVPVDPLVVDNSRCPMHQLFASMSTTCCISCIAC